ncbi:P-loop containing nucleoside triphosphate hydrolase protein [Hyaloraphidium curvatum]|nr:P-loop containing nucleoside triphosphate hydrolase protein [Hyaloraphidium curvatum]
MRGRRAPGRRPPGPCRATLCTCRTRRTSALSLGPPLLSVGPSGSCREKRPRSLRARAADKVFDEKSLNSHVYDGIARDIVMSTLDGVNGTIFAYGQTSSGKTFTMMGSGRHAGIIPMAIRDVFLYISQTPDREFLLRVSYLEIYNEVIKDLLAPENDNLKIHENPNREIFVGGLTEEIVLAPEEVMRLMSKGEANRHTGETNMNERSSRSHTIFRMVIESRERRTEGEGASRSSYSGAVKVSSLVEIALRITHQSLVDLAGSERVGHTGAEGIRLKEGGHINKSLLTLGTVIGKLSEGSDKVHIPYRDSKLTRILQPSLGGNARTAIICTITMAQAFAEETVSTLKFASRAKTIRNRPEVNEVISDEALLKRYKKEIDSLKAQLDELKSKDPKDTDKISKTRSIEEQQMLQTKFEELRMMILNSSRAGEAQTAPARKARALRRQTWFPGVNPHFSDEVLCQTAAFEWLSFNGSVQESEDDAKGQSGIAETDR